MSDLRIDVFETGVRISGFEVAKKDVADYLGAFAEPERELALVRAIEVGVFCLERARTSQDLEFVRRQIDSLLNQVQSVVEKIPEETQKQLAAKIGTGEGQVLAPVQTLVNDVAKAAGDKIRDVRDLLEREIDPTKQTSTLGKALQTLRELLDPKRNDSVQGSFDAAMKQVAAENGPLATAVKKVVAESVKPLVDQVDALAKEVRGRDAAAEALEQTTHKGVTYEDEVVRILQDWGQHVGAEVHHVGPDKETGDVVLCVDESSVGPTMLRIVVEARDRQAPVGRKVISDLLSGAMSERNAGAGVYVSRGRDGLGQEIGEWAEGQCEQGPWVACTHEHLITAVRFLLVQQRIQCLRASAPTVDSPSIEAQLKRIRTTLGRVKTINSKVTDVRGSADAIQTEAEAIRDEVRGALSDIEEALRVREPAVASTDASI